MLIYSIAPVDLSPAVQPSAPTRFCRFEHGYYEGVDSPQGFIIRRIISTDPTAYLSQTCYPGAIWQPPGCRPQ